jgi:hypothetical protein
MRSLNLFLFLLAVTCGVALAQKGTAPPDWYPQGYAGSTWTGEVTAFDKEGHTLTLTYTDGKKVQTFIATIPDEPFEWTRDIRNNRVLDFAYDKTTKGQMYAYKGEGSVASILPEGGGERGASGTQRRPNPPPSDERADLAVFMGRRITVYYTTQERKVAGVKTKYNDVWRILVLPAAKK